MESWGRKGDLSITQKSWPSLSLQSGFLSMGSGMWREERNMPEVCPTWSWIQGQGSSWSWKLGGDFTSCVGRETNSCIQMPFYGGWLELRNGIKFCWWLWEQEGREELKPSPTCGKQAEMCRRCAVSTCRPWGREELCSEAKPQCHTHPSSWTDREPAPGILKFPSGQKCLSFSWSVNSVWFRSILVTAGGEHPYMAYPRISCARDRESTWMSWAFYHKKRAFFFPLSPS